MNFVLRSSTALAVALTALGGTAAHADMEAAIAFLDANIQRSALTREEQEAEMQWFVDAAAPFQGMEIKRRPVGGGMEAGPYAAWAKDFGVCQDLILYADFDGSLHTRRIGEPVPLDIDTKGLIDDLFGGRGG